MDCGSAALLWNDGTTGDNLMKRLFVGVALALAGMHHRCGAFWNDVAEALLTGRSLAEVRKQREDDHDA